MADDRNDLIELLPRPQNSEAGPRQSDLKPDCEDASRADRRDYFDTLAITFGLFIAGFILFICLKDLRGGIEIVTMVGYTLMVLYFASDQFRNYVPWELLTRKRSLLAHSLALVIVCGFTTEAFALKPRFPGWFLAEHRKGSLFYWSFALFFVVLAICECSWISRHQD